MSLPQPFIRVALRRDVHAAQVDEHLVLLDVEADRYFCLPTGGPASVGWGSRTLDLADNELASTLLQAGLAEPATNEMSLVGRPFPPAPEGSAIRAQYRGPRPSDLFVGLAAMIDLARCYRNRSLSHILTTIASRPFEHQSEPTAAVLEEVERFQTWSPYAPVSGKCLLRSFMLLRALNRRGHDADWVFGVSTWPFRAHCWLQIGSVVLDDEVDAVRPFTPIMVR